MSIKEKYFNVKNAYDMVVTNHNNIKEPPKYLLAVYVSDEISYLASAILAKEKNNNYHSKFDLNFNNELFYRESIFSLQRLKDNFNLLLFNFDLDFDKFVNNHTKIRSIIQEQENKYNNNCIILNDYKIYKFNNSLEIYKDRNTNFRKRVTIYNKSDDDFNKEYFNAIINFDYKICKQNSLIITNGKMDINLLNKDAGDIGYICNDKNKVSIIGIKNNDTIHVNQQTYFINNRKFVKIDGFNNDLRTKIKTGSCLNKDEERELDRLLSLYSNVGYSVKV